MPVIDFVPPVAHVPAELPELLELLGAPELLPPELLPPELLELPFAVPVAPPHPRSKAPPIVPRMPPAASRLDTNRFFLMTGYVDRKGEERSLTD